MASTYTCPHCGVTYKMTVRRGGKPMYRTAVCSYCGDVMAEWYGHARHYRRTRRPPDPTTLARTLSRWPRAAAHASGHVATRGCAPVQRARLVLLVIGAERVADLDSRSPTHPREPKPN